MSTILRLFVLLVVASGASGIYGAEVADAPVIELEAYKLANENQGGQ